MQTPEERYRDAAAFDARNDEYRAAPWYEWRGGWMGQTLVQAFDWRPALELTTLANLWQIAQLESDDPLSGRRIELRPLEVQA